jgi:hypothetical protein
MSIALPTIRAIEAMDLKALRTCWRTYYGEPPSLRSLPILRMLLAWRVQSAAGEGLGTDVRAAIRRNGAVPAEGLDLGIGARLTRNWKGARIEVIVEPEGFSWEGHHYKSLSAVATAIAGTRWNGPRFFGLREQL